MMPARGTRRAGMTIEQRIVKRLNVKPGEVVVIPKGFHNELLVKYKNVTNAVEKLRRKGRTVIYEDQVGSHLADRSRMTTLQRDVLDACPFERGVYKIPMNLHKRMGKEEGSVMSAVRALEKRGHLFVFEGRYGGQVGTHVKDRTILTRLQQEVLNASTFKDGKYIVPADLPRKTGRQYASVKDAVGELQEKGYDMEKPLTELQEKILKKSAVRGDMYVISPGIHKQLKKGVGAVNSAVTSLKQRGFKIEFGLTELQERILEECPEEKGVRKVPPRLGKRLKARPGRVPEAIQDLADRGYVFAYEGQAGTHLKDRTRMTELQRRILEECAFKNGVYVIPQNPHKRLNREESSIAKAIKTLRKKGYVLFPEGQVGTHLKDRQPLTLTQQEFINLCNYRKGIYWVPKEADKLLGRREYTHRMGKLLEGKGYRFDRGLTKLQKRIISYCTFEDGVYVVPKRIDEMVLRDQRSVSASIRALHTKGFLFEFWLPPALRRIASKRGLKKVAIEEPVATLKEPERRELELVKKRLTELFRQGKPGAGEELTKLARGTSEEKEGIVQKYLKRQGK